MVEKRVHSFMNNQEKLSTIFNLMSNIDPEQDLETFMGNILRILINLIPDAEAGSIGIIRGNKFKYLAQQGYSDLLKKIDFPRDIIFKSEKATIFNDMHMKYHINMPEKYIRIFKKVGSDRIKSSLGMSLKTDHIIGNIFVDSFTDNRGFTDEDKRLLEAVSNVISLYTFLKLSLVQLDKTYFEMIKALAEAVEIKDKYTKGHSERVAAYSVRLGEKLNLAQDRLDKLKKAAVLHDIGKIGISDSILNKPKSLTDNEYDAIKSHSVLGGRVLKNVENLSEIAIIVRHHHERWDGSGYPDQLKGKQIPLESRIIAIFDALDTLLTARTYKKALPFKFALNEIRNKAGSQFDPDLVNVFLQHVSTEWILTQDLK